MPGGVAGDRPYADYMRFVGKIIVSVEHEAMDGLWRIECRGFKMKFKY
jgi:hypothetical protein